jgi:fucose 4-O-acetylase-like acetyltransferase
MFRDFKLKKEEKSRLLFLDNFRILFITWVIFHHSLRAYAPWWHYAVNEQELIGLTPVIGMNFAIMVNALFFLAGYFTPKSYNRGTKNYFVSRLKRIGAPFIFFSCLITIIKYFEHISLRPYGYIGFFKYFFHYYLGFGAKPLDWHENGWPDITYAHFWFLEYLLVFSIGYILIQGIRDSLKRKTSPNSTLYDDTESSIPSILQIWSFILIVAFATFMIRFWFPAGVWIVVLLFVVIEPAHIIQNVAFFIIGTIAVKKQWPNLISKNDAKFWTINGIIATILPFIVNSYRPFNHPDNFGGFTLSSVLFCIWELYFSISWLISLLWLFRQKYNHSTQISSWLVKNSFVTYMLHGFIILAIQMVLVKLNWPVFVKFTLVVIIGVPLSFISASIFKKCVPYAKNYW